MSSLLNEGVAEDTDITLGGEAPAPAKLLAPAAPAQKLEFVDLSLLGLIRQKRPALAPPIPKTIFDTNPDAVVEAVNDARVLGLPDEVAALDPTGNALAAQNRARNDATKSVPELPSFLEAPNAIERFTPDSLAGLGTAKKMWLDVKQGVHQAGVQSDLTELAGHAFISPTGYASPEIERQIESLLAEKRVNYFAGDDVDYFKERVQGSIEDDPSVIVSGGAAALADAALGVMREVPGATANFAAQTLGYAEGAAVIGVGSAVIGAGLGALAQPEIAIPAAAVGAVMGWRAGTLIGSNYLMMKAEGLSWFLANRENGNSVNTNRALSVMVGVPAGFIEHLQVGAAFGRIPGFAELFGNKSRGLVTLMLRSKSLAPIIDKLGAQLATGAGENAMEEAGQEFMQIFGDLVGLQIASNKGAIKDLPVAFEVGMWDPTSTPMQAVLSKLAELHLNPFGDVNVQRFTYVTREGAALKGWEAIAARTGEAAYFGALGGFGVAAGGRAITGGWNMTQAARARASSEAAKRLGSVIQGSKAASSDPEILRGWLSHVSEQSGVSHVYLPHEVTRKLLQSPDGTKLAAIAPGLTAEVEKARATGADVAIDLPTYAAYIASNDKLSAIVGDEARFDPAGMSRREADTFVKQIGDQAKMLDELVAPAAEGESATPDAEARRSIFNGVYSQIVNAGPFDEATAAAQAKVYLAFEETMAKKKGISLAAALEEGGIPQIKIDEGRLEMMTTQEASVALDALRNETVVPPVATDELGEATTPAAATETEQEAAVTPEAPTEQENAAELPESPSASAVGSSQSAVSPAEPTPAASQEAAGVQASMPEARKAERKEKRATTARELRGKRNIESMRRVAASRQLDLSKLTNEQVIEQLSREAYSEEGARRTLEQKRRPQPLSSEAKKLLPYLTPAEVLKRPFIINMLAAEFELLQPSAIEIAASALAGRVKRGWYARSQRAIELVFGEDAARFTALLASFSPRTSVESNTTNALKIWTAWVDEGRPTDATTLRRIFGENVQGEKGEESVLDAWINNGITSLTAENADAITLSGPKAESFRRNLRGDFSAVTADAWVANLFALAGSEITGVSTYGAVSAKFRQAAEILTQKTGETWTPAEVQETAWSWAKALLEKRQSAKEGRRAQDIVAQDALSQVEIAGTPDFELLFVLNQTYRKILEPLYGTQLRSAEEDARAARSALEGAIAASEETSAQATAPLGHLGRAALQRSAQRIEHVYQARVGTGLALRDLADTAERSDKQLKRDKFVILRAALAARRGGEAAAARRVADAIAAGDRLEVAEPEATEGDEADRVATGILDLADTQGRLLQQSFVEALNRGRALDRLQAAVRNRRTGAISAGSDHAAARAAAGVRTKAIPLSQLRPGEPSVLSVGTPPADLVDGFVTDGGEFFTREQADAQLGVSTSEKLGGARLGAAALRRILGQSVFRGTGRKALEGDRIEPTAPGNVFEVEVPGDHELLDRDKPISEKRALYQEERASIDLTDPQLRSVVIRLSDKSDLTSLLHEFGHYFLARMERDAPKYAVIGKDLEAIKKWLGAPTEEAVTDAQHERFARALELYFMEGKPPSEELRGVFRHAKAWMLKAYQAVTSGYFSPNGEPIVLNDEVRSVFDRMLATDAQIEVVRKERGLNLKLGSLISQGFTSTEAEEYERRLEAARDEELYYALGDELKSVRKRAQEEKVTKPQLRKEAEAEASQDRRVQAFEWLARSNWLGKGEDPGIPRAKLSTSTLTDAYGADFVKKLPARVHSKSGVTIHADFIADALGYASGEELVNDLVAAQGLAEETKLRAEMAWKKQLDATSPSSLAARAVDAMESRKTLALLVFEERALAKKAGGAVAPTELLRRVANRIADSTAYRDANPHRFRVAAEKATRSALEAADKGDSVEAQKQKSKQRLSLLTEGAIRRGKEEADRVIEAARKGNMLEARKKLGLAGESYLATWDTLLDAYDLKPRSGVAVDRLKALRDWVEAQRAEGRDPKINPDVLEAAYKKSYQNATLEELRALGDALKNVVHLARLKTTLLDSEHERNIADVEGDLLAQIEETFPTVEPIPIEMTRGEERSEFFASAAASLKRVEFLIDELDARNSMGPWREMIWKPLKLAEGARNKMQDEYSKKTLDIMRNLIDGREDEYSRVQEYGALGVRASKYWLLAVALNFGNEGNLKRLIEGSPKIVQGGGTWTEAGLMNTFVSKFDKRDWDYVQATWDLVDSLWPQIVEQEKRRTGVAPERVKARTIETPFGEYRGGYFPVVYDARRNDASAYYAERNLFEQGTNGFAAPLTGHGFTESRKDIGRPLKLDLIVLPSHIDKVIHHLTHWEALNNVNELLRRPQVRAALAGRLGYARSYEKFWLPWLQSIARDRMIVDPTMEAANHFLTGARQRVITYTLGLRATTLLAQPLGTFNAFAIMQGRLPNWGKYYFSSAGVFSNPTQWLPSYESITSKSEFMRDRINHIDRDLRDVIRSKTLKAGFGDRATRYSMQLIGGVQLFTVDLPVWSAAYHGALAELSYTEEDAIDFADEVVSLSQGAAGAKDISAIQRTDAAWQQFLMFFSYINTVWNQLATFGFNTSSVKDVPTFLAKWALVVLAPQILAGWSRGLVSGHSPIPDEDEDGEYDLSEILKYLFSTALWETVGTLPAISGIGDLRSRMLYGKPATTPVGRMVDIATKAYSSTTNAAEQWWGGEDPDLAKLLIAWARVAGVYLGRPFDQLLQVAERVTKENDE